MKQYIYSLSDPRTNDVRYIGKTSNVKNRFKKHIKVSLDNIVTLKDEWIYELKNINLKPVIEILDIGDDLNINDLEIYWISQFKTWGFNLANMTIGGEGGNWIGVNHKESSKRKMMLNNPKRKIIVQYDLKGKVLGKYNSIREASRYTNLCRRHITNCCKNKKSSTVGGYVFRFSNDKFDYKPYIPYNTTKINKFDTNGNFIESYFSMTEASIKMNINKGRISESCKSGKPYKGYIYSIMNSSNPSL
jgi:hypothetical protein